MFGHGLATQDFACFSIEMCMPSIPSFNRLTFVKKYVITMKATILSSKIPRLDREEGMVKSPELQVSCLHACSGALHVPVMGSPEV